MPSSLDNVLMRLGWMRQQKIWSNGLRDLWTDAFGVVLLVSLAKVLREPRYPGEAEAIALVKQIHRRFVIPGRGGIWKKREDLSGPCPGYGLGALDAFHGYVVYRLPDVASGARRAVGDPVADPLAENDGHHVDRSSRVFCREPRAPQTRFAFTNYGVSIGLQAVREWPDRVEPINRYFEQDRSGDNYDSDAITHVMGCCS